MTDYDRVLTIDIVNGGKIIGIGIATGIYADAGVSELQLLSLTFHE